MTVAYLALLIERRCEAISCRRRFSIGVKVVVGFGVGLGGATTCEGLCSPLCLLESLSVFLKSVIVVSLG